MYVESGKNETISAYKRGLENLRSMAALFKHFPHFCPRSGFSCYSLDSSVGLRHGSRYHYFALVNDCSETFS